MSSDILTLLREYCMGRRKLKDIVYNNEQYVSFEEFSFPKDSQTPLAVYAKPGEYYTLDALLWFWTHRDMKHPEYVKDTSKQGIRVVTRTDKREILDYLSGQRSALPSFFDQSYPPVAAIPTHRLRTENAGEPERKKQKLDGQGERTRLDSILHNNEPQEGKQIRSLTENLDAEKISLLRKKKQLHQKNKIVETGDSIDQMYAQTQSQERGNRLERERIWRTRMNCMDSLTKDFSNIFDVLKALKEDGQSQAKSQPVVAPAPKPQIKPVRGQAGGYSRYDQEMFTKDSTTDFNIDTEVSFVGQSFDLNRDGKKMGPVSPTHHEKTKETAPRPIPTQAPKPHHAPAPSSTQKSSAEPPAPRRRTNRTPIIVIPGGMTGTLINMYNVRDILQDMTYKTPDERKAAGTKRETEVQLHRKRGDVTVPYRVIENPTRLTDEEWDRVVAVFVMGPTWQFKGWKWNGNPVEIFSHIPAFHIHYDDLKIDKNVAQWSVTFIPISRDKRHLDKARLAKFWDTLDRHMVKHKSHLRF